MKHRCDNPKGHNADSYYFKGISYCKRWAKFENFLADMGECPIGRSIDRINNDDDYKPSNCRWATPKQQANNRGVRRWQKKPKTAERIRELDIANQAHRMARAVGK